MVFQNKAPINKYHLGIKILPGSQKIQSGNLVLLFLRNSIRAKTSGPIFFKYEMQFNTEN